MNAKSLPGPLRGRILGKARQLREIRANQLSFRHLLPQNFRGAQKLLSIGLVASSLALSLGCGDPLPPPANAAEYTERAEALYNEGMMAIDDRNWLFAVDVFERLKVEYPYSRYARLASLRIADVLYEEHRFAEAVTAYKVFIQENPNDVEVSYARYRITKSYFEQGSESLFQPPLEERELGTVRDAYANLLEFARDYPGYGSARELDYMLESLSGTLVRHELYVARFYLGRGEPEATITRIQFALRSFPGSQLEPEALVLLGETYLSQKENDKAEALFQYVIMRYPANFLIGTAKNFLADMERRGVRSFQSDAILAKKGDEIVKETVPPQTVPSSGKPFTGGGSNSSFMPQVLPK